MTYVYYLLEDMMAKNPGRMALYEVIKKSQTKYAVTSRQDTKNADKNDKSQVLPDSQGQTPSKSGVDAQQFMFGKYGHGRAHKRKRFKVPYTGLVITVIILALILFAAFKIGQIYNQKVSVPDTAPVGIDINSAGPDIFDQDQTASGAKLAPDESTMLTSIGDHVIVIATCIDNDRDLIPVVEFFNSNEIATEIQKKGNNYLLVTSDKVQNPEKQGTDGFLLKQRIKRIGQDYSAPKGYNGFGTKPFQDAYGMKVQ